MTTPTPDEICERLAVQTLLDYRRRDGLTCYAYDSNRVKDEANMKAAFAEIVAPAIQQQRAEIEMLSAALEFYANRRSYGTRKVHRGIRYSDVDLDGGERARNALGEE